QITLKQMLRDFIGIRVNRAKKSGMVNITSSVNSRERSGINTILHELNPLFTINVTMRDIKSKNVYSRVNSKATTQWRKTESANGVHLEGVASDNMLATDNNTVGMGDAGIKSAIQGSNVPNPDEAVPSFVSGAMAKAGKGLLEGTLQAGTSAVSDKLLDLVGLGGKSAAAYGKLFR